eukprot:scaffold68950_cov31-Tisochrysis_lutea.AAC.1
MASIAAKSAKRSRERSVSTGKDAFHGERSRTAYGLPKSVSQPSQGSVYEVNRRCASMARHASFWKRLLYQASSEGESSFFIAVGTCILMSRMTAVGYTCKSMALMPLLSLSASTPANGCPGSGSGCVGSPVGGPTMST